MFSGVIKSVDPEKQKLIQQLILLFHAYKYHTT